MFATKNEIDKVAVLRHKGYEKDDQERQTSSKPSLSQREFHEKDRRKAYNSFEAFRKRVRSSPRTMTTSGQAFFASWISCNLRKPWESQYGG
jgi:hypothetical protein